MPLAGPADTRRRTLWVKDAVRLRHSAEGLNGGPGAWTVLEEYLNYDLLAFAAWSSATPRVKGVGNPIIGYEVKVSRQDYRKELLNPSKRARNVARVNQFYFVVPAGLLKKEEMAWIEPEHHQDGSAFVRDPCPGRCRFMSERDVRYGTADKLTRKAGRWETIPTSIEGTVCDVPRHHRPNRAGPVKVEPGREVRSWEAGGHRRRWVVCSECGGKGYAARSVVEEEAPTLWIPADVGLLVVEERGVCRSVRKAPIRSHEETRGSWSIGQLVRHASFRPDPRHRLARS